MIVKQKTFNVLAILRLCVARSRSEPCWIALCHCLKTLSHHWILPGFAWNWVKICLQKQSQNAIRHNTNTASRGINSKWALRKDFWDCYYGRWPIAVRHVSSNDPRNKREVKHHVYVKRQTRICTTWPSFPFTCRLLIIISTHKLAVARNFYP